jgi:hypothetical protein
MNPGLNPILERVNRENKTITTPVGDLPISPLMDPVYHETRTRWTKPKAPQRTVFEKQKWRRHLERNPWALALATPMRRCPGTSTCLPKFFLQDFNIVLHPETEQPWFVPTSLVAPQQGQQQGTESTPQEVKTTSKPGPLKKPAGPTAYMIARQDYLAQQTQNGELHRMEYKKLMMLHHNSDRIKPIANRAIWREDMESLVLRLMRRRVLEDLIYLSTLSADTTRDPYVVRCQTWDDVKDDKYRGQRGCVLWLGPEGEDGGPGPRATMDIPGVKYGRKIAVHNLWRLLGEEGVEKLRESVELFREGEVFLVLRKRTVEMQMKLWKLQGFLAHPFVSFLDPATGNPRKEVEVDKEDEGQGEKEWEEEVGMENEEEEFDMAEDDMEDDNGDWEKQIQALRRMEAEEPRGRATSSF